MPRALNLSVATLVMGTLAGPVWSLTALDAWEGWKEMNMSFGQSVVTESERYAGSTLTVTGATFSMSDEDDGAFTYRIPELVFEEQGDGSVDISVSDTYDIAFAGIGEEGESITGTATLSHPGLEVTASDGADGVNYSYTAPGATLVMRDFQEDGEPIDLAINIGFGAISGTYASPESGTLEARFDGADMTLAVSGTDTEEGGDITMNGSLSSISVNSTSSSGSLFGSMDLPSLLEGGFETSISTRVGAATLNVDAQGPGEQSKIDISLGGSTAEVRLSPDAISYDVTYDDMDVGVSGSEIPFPRVEIGLGSMDIGLFAPLSQTDAPEPFGLNLSFFDVSIGDPLWNLFDPASVLPRDPADVAIQVAGSMRWLVDLMDADIDDVDMPAEVTSLDINQILLRVAGAELVGEGSFTFDITDMETFDGLPRPEGSLDLVLTGANTLLDRLVQMGLVQDDQAMMARMMSGMLLRPGEGADELISEIAIGPSGQITANGAPLPF